MHRRTMHIWNTRGDLDRADRVGGLERAHRHQKRAMKATGLERVDIRDIDAGDTVALEKLQPQPSLQHCFLERERAAQCKGHKVVSPIAADVGNFLHERAVPEYVITGYIGPDVEIFGQCRQPWVADIRARNQRTRLRITLAKK